MSRLERKLGYAVGTAIRGTGTLIAGSAGVASKIIGAGASNVSKELGRGFSQIGDNCFGVAHSIWTGEKAHNDGIRFDKYYAKLELMISEENYIYKYIYDKDSLRKILEKYDIDPNYVDNPKFIAYLEQKVKKSMRNFDDKLNDIVNPNN